MSHPLRMCGLKCDVIKKEYEENEVTSLTDVWIEMLRICQYVRCLSGHIPYGCVDWNKFATIQYTWFNCHIPYGCVDWNEASESSINFLPRSHPLRMCGLKYRIHERSIWQISVTSHTDVWIEMLKKWKKTHLGKSHIPYGCVDWNQ